MYVKEGCGVFSNQFANSRAMKPKLRPVRTGGAQLLRGGHFIIMKYIFKKIINQDRERFTF